MNEKQICKMCNTEGIHDFYKIIPIDTTTLKGFQIFQSTSFTKINFLMYMKVLKFMIMLWKKIQFIFTFEGNIFICIIDFSDEFEILFKISETGKIKLLSFFYLYLSPFYIFLYLVIFII